MPKSKHSEAAISAALKQLDARRSAADVAREVGVSQHTIYAWKAKYGGMNVTEIQEAKHLRDENARLRKLVANLSLDKDALQMVIENKRMELAGMKAAVEQIRTRFAFSERRACGLLRLAVNTFRYHPTERNADLRERLIQTAREKPRFGYWRLHVLVNRDGLQVNHKRVWRVSQEAGLAMKKVKRRRLIREGRPLTTVKEANEEWALEFVSDAIQSGRHIRLLAIVDAYTRECLALEVDTSFASWRVTGVLDRVIAERGRPGRIRCDNGAKLNQLALSGVGY